MSGKVLKHIESLFITIKRTPFSLGAFVLSLLCIIVIRTFFEYIFESTHLIAAMDNFYDNCVEYLHIIFSWSAVFFSVALLLNLFTKESITQTLTVVLHAFGIIIIVPILDYFVFESGKILYETSFENFFFKFFHLFNPTYNHIPSVTNGVRIEILLVVLLSALYLYTTTKKLLPTVLASIGVYCIIFFYGYLPALYNTLLDTTYDTIVTKSVLPTQSLINLNFYSYIPLFLLLMGAYTLKMQHKYRYMIFDSLRIERLGIYLGIFLFAVFVSAKSSFLETELLNLYDIFKIFSAFLSILFSFVYASTLNNIYDISIDTISNTQRVLVRYDLPLSTYISFKNIALFFALSFAIAVNSTFIFIIIAMLALSHIYSAPPLRLKRFFLISNLLLTLIATLTYLAGVSVVESNAAFINANQLHLTTIFLLFFVASHFKDMKDAKADKKHGITTLFTLFNTKKTFLFLQIVLFLLICFEMYLYHFSLPYIVLLGTLYGSSFFFIQNGEKFLVFFQLLSILLGYGIFMYM